MDGRWDAALISGRWVWWIAWAVPIVVAGCSSGDPAREARLIAARPFEPDIPIPGGFVLVDSASEDRSTGVSRLYVRHLYSGSADKHAVRGFYREQMPLARWSRVSDGNVKGEITMRFEKGAESCTLVITDSDDRFRRKTHVQVIVAREERGQAPPTLRSGT
ncbi:MAG: hypothetical protein HOP29_19685 [Phycisphaerales bacterium]|nr:hypothetical protein [Phycisphaerales bacterium]